MICSRQALGVFIGRFQFFHKGHLDAVRQGLGKVEKLLILVGSSNQPRTYFNPFTFVERREMIWDSLPEDLVDRVQVLPLEDMKYNDTKWASQVREKASQGLEDFNLVPTTPIKLVGFKKDGTSYYLNMFPDWGEATIKNTTGLSATQPRENYFLRGEIDTADVLPKPVRDFMSEFRRTEQYQHVRQEYEFIKRYQEPYKSLPYPPIFTTVDACVVQAGHVLLVRRRAEPGRGLWALPGGFLNAKERIEDAIYRELIEETKIEVPEAVLRGRTEFTRVYDDVHRSARGRTITHAALILLETPPRRDGRRVPLPKVRGSDDADKARWFPLAGPGALTPGIMFEDHYSIIADLTAEL